MTDLVTDPNPGITPDNGSVIRTDQHNEIISRLEGTASTKIRIGAILIDAALNVGAQSITTTQFQILEGTDPESGGGTNGLYVQSTVSGNNSTFGVLASTASPQASNINIYNGNSPTDSAVLSISAAGPYHSISADANGAGEQLPIRITTNGFTKTWEYGLDGSLSLPGTLVLGANSITTTTYTVKEDTDFNTRPAVEVAATGTNQRSVVQLTPSGDSVVSQLILNTTSTKDGTGYVDVLAYDTGCDIEFVGANLSDDVNLKISGNAGQKQWAFHQDGSLTLPGNLVLGANSITTASYILQEVTGGYSGRPEMNLQPAAGDTGTRVGIAPHGTDHNTELAFYQNTDQANSGVLTIGVSAGAAYVGTDKSGSGTAPDFVLNTPNAEWDFKDADKSLTLPGPLKTTTYTISESTDQSTNADIRIQPTSGDNAGVLNLLPSGSSVIGQISVFSSSNQANSTYAYVLASNAGVVFGSDATDGATPLDLFINTQSHFWQFSELDGSLTLPGALKTATYTVKEATTAYQANPSIDIQPTSGDNSSLLTLRPKGVTQFAAIDIFNNEDDTASPVLEIGAASDKTYIYSYVSGAVSILPFDIFVGTNDWKFGTDGNLSLPGALKTTNYTISESAGGYLSTAVRLQASAGDVATELDIAPHGSRAASFINVFDNADPTNATLASLQCDTGTVYLLSDKTNVLLTIPDIVIQPGGKAFTFKQATGNLEMPASGSFVLSAGNIATDTSTGTKIATATNQKLGFYNTTPVVQPSAVSDASGGATVDSEARTALNTLLSRLRDLGIIAT